MELQLWTKAFDKHFKKEIGCKVQQECNSNRRFQNKDNQEIQYLVIVRAKSSVRGFKRTSSIQFHK